MDDIIAATQVAAAEFFFGFRRGITYAWEALQTASVKRHLLNSAIGMVVSAVIAYILISILSLPLRLIVYLIDAGFGLDWSTAVSTALSPLQLLQVVFWYAHSLFFLMYRFVLGSGAFWAVMQDVDRELYDLLNSIPDVQSWGKQLWRSVLKTLKLIGAGILITLLSFLPHIGPFVPTMAYAILYFRRITGQSLNVLHIFVLFLVVLTLPDFFVRKVVLYQLRLQLSIESLARELLLPFYAKFKHRRTAHRFEWRHRYVLVGFGSVFYGAFLIAPPLGLFVCHLSEGAAARVLLLLLARTQDLTENDPDYRPHTKTVCDLTRFLVQHEEKSREKQV